MNAPRILIADDSADVVEALRLALKQEGYEIEAVSSPGAVIRAAGAHDFDLAIIDLNYTRDTTSGAEGLDLLEQLHAYDSALPVVVMTAWATVEIAVEAMRRGARDFLQKPWDNARLLAIVRNQTELSRALRRNERLEKNLSTPELEMVAASPAMKPVLELIRRIGPSDANVLIRGENGTGKGVVARALHAASKRAARPLVSVNAGGLSEGVFESELFGHAKGAFTDAKSERIGRFELADGGTLFLDEIANVPLAQQAKLLRVVESGEFERVGSSKTLRVDVRLISATNAALEDDVEAGRFRRDLLFRLNTVEIRLPPLRDRRDDIPALAAHFLRATARRYRKQIAGFDAPALKALLDHAWPGNVRELEHVVERAVLMTGGAQIARSDLGLAPAANEGRLDDLSLEEVEALLIRKALVRFDGNVSKAADALGLSRSALYRRIQRYGL
ncbi:MAG: sigma-54-dependent Fis family transcriptional regulator [Acidobacteria bacterium]|nr:sigma-54-dependent Fis family transcriptional regulator [Acidobacteriota bacterium]MBV9478671.1 sigma-54-dependent Fis family transcriptional regulator [Acidobacteriota bacterium]